MHSHEKNLMCPVIFAALFFLFSPQMVFSQSVWLWPIKGYEAGHGLAGWPQQEMGGELNFGYIFIAAPEGTEVVCPADGIVSHFSVGFHSSLTSSSSYHFDSDNFNAIFDELAAGGEYEGLPVPAEYLCGDITIRLDDGRNIFISGLSGDVPMKTGMRLNKGDVIGEVKYAYHKIKEPHIMLNVYGSDGTLGDPMSPFGLKSTFAEPDDTATAPEWLTREQAEEDFAILMEAYRECFPSLDEIVTPEQMRAFEADAAEAFMEGISYGGFYDIVRSSVSSRLVHDSHVKLDTPNPKVDNPEQIYVPNIAHGISDGCVFVKVVSEQYREHLGKKIVSIDGISSDEIIRISKERVIMFDGGNESRVERSLLMNNWFLYNDVSRPRAAVIVLEDGTVIRDEWDKWPSGKKYYPQWTENSAYIKNLMNTRMKFSFAVLDDSAVLFRISTFSLNDTEMDELRDSLSHYIYMPNMIIDVRNNPGGDVRVVKKLASVFLNGTSAGLDSYRMVKDTAFSSMKYSLNYPETAIFSGYEKREGRPGFYKDDDEVSGEIVPDSILNYKGRVYVLTDETSCSAASLFPSILVKAGRAETVGRETGSGYHYITAYDFARIRLPNSLITVRIPLVKCVFDEVVSERFPSGRGLMPDYEVPLTYEEIYTSETDPVLEKALELISERKFL